MFEIKVQAEFEAAHRIADYPGKCNRLHGHNWKVEVVAVGRDLDELGMLVDFKQARRAVEDALAALDHRYLNELPEFRRQNPTAENIAKHLYGELAGHALFTGRARLDAVTVWESPRSSVTYREGA